MKLPLSRKPPFEKYIPYLLFIFMGYCIADLVILNYRGLMLPTQAPPARPQKSDDNLITPRGALNTIISRNIFSSDGVIPDALVPAGQEGRGSSDDSAPVLSSLPLVLKGTIVHSNPEKSIANIEVRSKNTTLAYGVGRKIEGLATLEKVERTKAILRNLNNNRLEFIEMKTENGKISFGKGNPAPGGKSEIAQVAPNKYEIKRSDLLKHTADMASLLQQASMIPRRGPGGEIECFRFVAIQPGSIFTQLGFQPGDCLKGVNGEKIDSPAKAMQMYNSLKSASNIKIQMERDGRDTESDYTVK